MNSVASLKFATTAVQPRFEVRHSPSLATAPMD
jgi:hypothetical protein